MKLLVLILTLHAPAHAWGVRGHVTANRAAIDALPDDGPVFLREYREWIGVTGPLPDSWRGTSEPYSKLFEDPNHGWFKEQFSFMKEVPRSRYDFVIRLHEEYLRLKDSNPERAKLTNIRWTGTLPYAAIENYDRMKAAMRGYRAAKEGSLDRRHLAHDIAFYAGWLGHYTADGAMPLHNSIHHDGWQGENPKDFTRDGGIPGRFENSFVELIQLKEADLALSPAAALDDPFAAIIAHLDDSYTHVEEVYQMDKRKAFADKGDRQARDLVARQLSRASALLRDLVYTAWLESAKRVPPGPNPTMPSHPGYHPATGTAPPPGKVIPNR